MKAQELRIGNFVRAKSPEKKEWVEEHKISAHTLYSMQYPNAMDIVKPDLKPITLTEEWLLRLGFKHIDDKLYCKRWRLDRVDIYKMISGEYPFYFRFNQVDLKIESIHQLQNLYFALTGEELELK